LKKRSFSEGIDQLPSDFGRQEILAQMARSQALRHSLVAVIDYGCFRARRIQPSANLTQ